MITRMTDRLANVALVLFLVFFTLIAGTVPPSLDPILRLIGHGMLLAVVGVWLVVLLVRRRPFPRTPIDLPLWAFLAAMLLATLFSVNRRVSAELLLVNLLYALFFYVVVDLVRMKGGITRLVTANVLVATVVIALSLVELVGWYLGLLPFLGFEQGWPQIAGWSNPVPPTFYRLSVALSVPNVLGAYLILTIPLGVAAARASRARAARAALTVWVLLGVIVLFFSFSRGAWVGFAASMLALAAAVLRSRGTLARLRALTLRRWPLMLALGLVLVGILALIAQPAAHILGVRGSEEARLLLYRNALTFFGERPLLGFGLGSFGQVNLEHVSGTTLQSAVHGHAHNAYLNSLAEMGLVGTVPLLWLLLAIGRIAWRTAARREGERARWLGLATVLALIASATQDLFEAPLDSPAILFPTIIIVAIMLELFRRSSSQGIAPARALSPAAEGRQGLLCKGAVMATCCLIAAALTYIGCAYLVYNTGQRAVAAGNWKQAQESMAQAVALDPTLVFYRFELSFVQGRGALQTGDRAMLLDAIRGYEAALAEDGSYALNHANLATLYWADGKGEQAVDAMRKALALDGTNALYYLNLGLYYQQLGQLDAAVATYGKAIRLDGGLLSQSFWREDTQRRELWPGIVREAGLEASPTLLAYASPSPPLLAPTEGAASDLSALGRQVDRQPAISQPRVERARAYLSLGDLDRAEKDLRAAIFIDSNPLAHYYLGEVGVRRGDRRLAEAQFARVAISRPVPMGYGYLVYRRIGLPAQYLPGFVEPLLNDSLVGPALSVAQYYESVGRAERASEIYTKLVEYDPGLTAARDGLKRTRG